MLLRKLFKLIFTLIAIAAVLISLQYMLNGGFESYKLLIENEGFFGFLKWFFESIWNGFKDTVGI